MVQSLQTQTSGVAVLDTLIDGVRVGDNLVVTLDEDVPHEWLVARYVNAAAAERLIVVDAFGRHGQGGRVLDWSPSDVTPARARDELAAADERIGTDAAFVVDSLSTLARRWGEQEALDLFLWGCPRLFRRGSVAMWIVRAEQHGDEFLRRLTAVTQVVVHMRAVDKDVHLEVRKADGRAEAVTGRAVLARLDGAELVDARPVDVERQRLGEHLRQLRTMRGVGQAELARRVGISPSALSQAERGVRAVSAETLMRIWDTLGLPVSAAAAGRGFRVHRRGSQSAVALAPGVTGRRRSDDSAPTVWHLAFAARTSGRNPLFPVKATETVLVLRGVLQVELQGTAEALHEGDTLVADTAAITAWANPADTPAEALWVITA